MNQPAALPTPPRGNDALRRAPSDDAAAGVLAAVWCRSVGSAWTLELRELDRDTALGTIRDWISSGVPISQPAPPEALVRVLLAERGLQLFHDPSTGPRTPTRHGIGYVCTDAELITLAHLARDAATEVGVHPVVLVTLWIAAGFSANTAASRIREGIHSPPVVPNPRSRSPT